MKNKLIDNKNNSFEFYIFYKKKIKKEKGLFPDD